MRKINPVSFEENMFEQTLTRSVITEKYAFKNQFCTVEHKVHQKRVDYIMQFGVEPKYLIIHPYDAYNLIKDYTVGGNIYFDSTVIGRMKYMSLILMRTKDVKEGELYVV